MVLEPFDYKGVTLDAGMLKRQFDETRDFYLRIPNDDLLKGYRQRAGLPAPGVEMGGWYSADIGNIYGQVISGLARMYAATGDPACLAKVNAMVTEWGKCIGHDGYPFASMHPQGIAYIFDKLVGGLVDAIVYADNKEAVVLLARITDWGEKNLNRVRDYANADGAGAPRVAWSEWYTLGENLDRAYLATGDKRYRDFAEVWEYTEYWSIYANNGDIHAPRANGEITSAYHAYSHVNTLSSAAMAYMVKGDKRYLDTLRNAYDYLQSHQCFATGGYGPNEQLVPHDELLRLTGETHNTVETQCCSWAGFRMSRYLILFTGDARYGDWIERLLYNCIGASLPNADDGRVFYYADYNPHGACKVLYGSGWSCCSGSRPIAVAAYHDLIYFKDKSNLYVNLYTPSTVEWNGVTVRQRTRFPEADTSEFVVSVSKPTEFALHLRVPQWLAGPMSLEVNGKPADVRPTEKHWVTIRRQWHDGDKATVTLPMALRAEPLDPKGYPAAICYGPVVMAMRSPEGNPAKKIDLQKLDEVFVPSPGESLTYHLRGDDNILVRPFYAVREGEPYFVYLDPDAG
jgi:DUF1680 family protein